ncbi:LPS export ABC transporter periplasmic protein LptC [Ottowia testudinis]|uniref:LPS export ABC transporter periplasmic protein LptC n=2 Tax=Ottowia testudinis TaxID=2816950 RepID=A0A975CKI4_9BURK|nr:LPS export ABC transporter periplasmic protein LptC [Ottowia testudinis]QTD47511.1 LPS export ABC transporter periplasmic protein LptC [Ottowia testudinis]
MARLMRYGRDQLSAWLPALLMMVFALGTWWLVRSAPRALPSDQGQIASTEPDYFMRQFSVRSFEPDGRLKSEVFGAEGRHLPADDTLEITQPRIVSFDEQGHPTVATAQRAVAKGDGSEARLYQDARVVREPIARAGKQPATPRLEFQGDFLHVFIDDERVSSDQPVQLRRGADIFTGDVFAYDDRSGVAELTGRVRGVLQPRK